MSRSYWVSIFAVVGWIVLIGANQPSPAQINPYQVKGSHEIGRNPTKANEVTPESEATNTPDTGCNQGEDNRHSDLCAQWKAADAAFDAAKWAWLQFISGIIGIALGAGTLFAAIAAAFYARHAAQETKRSADAALMANANTIRAISQEREHAQEQRKISQAELEIMKSQNRPWIAVSAKPAGSIEILNGTQPTINVTLSVENVGSLPARFITSFTFAEIIGPLQMSHHHFAKLIKDHGEMENFMKAFGAGGNIYFPGEKNIFKLSIAIKNWDNTPLPSETGAIVVGGVTQYYNGDSACYTGFAYVATRKDGKPVSLTSKTDLRDLVWTPHPIAVSAK
jgi:hypothetical protein